MEAFLSTIEPKDWVKFGTALVGDCRFDLLRVTDMALYPSTFRARRVKGGDTYINVRIGHPTLPVPKHQPV